MVLPAFTNCNYKSKQMSLPSFHSFSLSDILPWYIGSIMCQRQDLLHKSFLKPLLEPLYSAVWYNDHYVYDISRGYKQDHSTQVIICVSLWADLSIFLVLWFHYNIVNREIIIIQALSPHSLWHPMHCRTICSELSIH